MTKSEEGEDSGQKNEKMKETIGRKTLIAGMPRDKAGFHYFRLFSYLSMAILSVSIMVGMFIIIQHINEEEQEKDSLGKQESVIKNQELIMATHQNLRHDIMISLDNQKNILTSQKIVSTILNETRRDNAAFFKILEDMTENQTTNFNYLAQQRMNQSAENGKKLDKIIEYLKIK